MVSEHRAKAAVLMIEEVEMRHDRVGIFVSGSLVWEPVLVE